MVTALPSIGRDLHAGLQTLQWTVNAYGIAVAAGIISAAALGDRFGRRRIFVSGVVLFTAASAACGLAGAGGPLIAARSLQGLGAAAITLSLTILTDAFPPERRGAVVGTYGGLAGLATALGPLIGGLVTEGLDWHWIFWINIPIGILVTGASARLLPQTHGPRERIDACGVTLVSAGAVSLVWGLVRSGSAGWDSFEILATLLAGAVLLAAFIGWEAVAPAPMIPPRLFRRRSFAFGSATQLLMSGSIFAAAFLIIQYVQIARGYSPVETGVRLLPWLVTPMLVSPLAGSLGDRIGPRPLIAGGLTMQAGGFAWIAIHAGSGLGYDELAISLLLAGIGISMALPTAGISLLGALVSLGIASRPAAGGARSPRPAEPATVEDLESKGVEFTRPVSTKGGVCSRRSRFPAAANWRSMSRATRRRRPERLTRQHRVRARSSGGLLRVSVALSDVRGRPLARRARPCRGTPSCSARAAPRGTQSARAGPRVRLPCRRSLHGMSCTPCHHCHARSNARCRPESRMS